MTNALGALSAAIGGIVATAAPMLCAVRTGPNRHVTGLLLESDVVVTVDQALPVAESYTIVLSDRSLISARPGPRDPSSNLAVMRLDSPVVCKAPAWSAATPGLVVVVVGADADASPTVRLTVVHRLAYTIGGLSAILDLPGGSAGPGDLVLDANGHLIGLAAVGPNDEAMAIPGGAVVRVVVERTDAPAHDRAAAPAWSSPAGRRGWLGVALQPISIPDQLSASVGQASGRLVVSITSGGPADKAGLRVNDVLLALNGTSTTGPNALRAFLGAERIGSHVEVRLLRDRSVMTAQLVVGAQPG